MRTGRPKTTLKLNEDEKRELTSLAHRSRAALARRACIVLACAEDTTTRRWQVSCRSPRRRSASGASDLCRTTGSWKFDKIGENRPTGRTL
jgi:hypothetical protein